MSFREKSAWISAVLISLFLLSFVLVNEHLNAADRLHPFLLVVVTFVTLEIVLHALIAIRSPRDARAPKDERERLIALKASRFAYYVLMVGALLSIFTIHLGWGADMIVGHVFLSVLVAELVRFISIIVFHRRGV